MIILPDNEMHRFKIKQIQKEIEKHNSEEKQRNEIKQKYFTVKKAWEDLFKQNIDDLYLYRYKNNLESEYFNLGE